VVFARARTFVNSVSPRSQILVSSPSEIVHHGALIEITGVVTNGSSSTPVSLKLCGRGPSNPGNKAVEPDRQWNLSGT
jgi:hypothetical protein